MSEADDGLVKGSREDLWKKRAEAIDLYKFWLKMILQVNIASLGIIGAIISFGFVDNPKLFHPAAAALVAIATPVAIILAIGAYFLRPYEKYFSELSSRIGPKDLPAFILLRVAAIALSIVHGVVAVGAIFVMLD